MVNSSASQVYVYRIRKISNARPILLVSYSYVWYVGDLSG
ncbi:biliverdin-producing heme oxygenase [cyanobacterium endosymbiont of Rhopalodia gibberula]